MSYGAVMHSTSSPNEGELFHSLHPIKRASDTTAKFPMSKKSRQKEGKAVPAHALLAHWRVVVKHHSFVTQHQMEVNGHSLATV
jgi:hypothetical protein